MSKEAAAATLTQIYFDKVNARVTPRKPTDKLGVEAVEEIGFVYGAFLARLDGFEERGRASLTAPKP
jgi:hypothetical protein